LWGSTIGRVTIISVLHCFFRLLPWRSDYLRRACDHIISVGSFNPYPFYRSASVFDRHRPNGDTRDARYSWTHQLSGRKSRIVERVENYFKDQCGQYAGEVQGRWSSASTEHGRIQLRAELTHAIATRLQRVFENELNSDETRAQLDALTGDLHSAFGTYRGAFKASLYTLLGLGYATGALSHLAEAAGTALKGYTESSVVWMREGVSSASRSILEATLSSVSNLVSFCYTAVTDAVVDAANNDPTFSPLVDAAKSVSQTFHHGADSTMNAVYGGISTARESALTLLPDTAPNYAAPYWSGTNRTLVGYNPDGTAIHQHSCISGLPATPRVGGEREFDFLGYEGTRSSYLSDVLRGANSSTNLSPDPTSELLRGLRNK
jgi:hypothetical protein